MINNILTPVGLPYRETAFPRGPAGDYIIYHDDVTADGPDGYNRIYTHDITVELYTAAPNPAAEAALEAELDRLGIHWTRQSRLWVDGAQRYQTAYDFTYTMKT